VRQSQEERIVIVQRSVMALFYYFLFVCELSSYVQAVKVENGIETTSTASVSRDTWVGENRITWRHPPARRSQRMLGNLRAAFYSRRSTTPCCQITEDTRGRLPAESQQVVARWSSVSGCAPKLTMEFFRGFRWGRPGCEVWIFHASAPCGRGPGSEPNRARSTSAYGKV